MGVELSQFELDAIKQLDIVSMNAANKPLKQTKIGKKEK